MSVFEIPNDYSCPITLNIMEDPVICDDGYTYERMSILNLQDNISPMTRQPINKSKLIPNQELKKSIDQFKLNQNLYI